ncbi:MAG: hypothetical protein NC432_13520 [Roseburia sp.]|nr:hypothetical protein [Roseburia sp.]MCM1098776.1 hypothetical protein [Ruminococcus flavefaciens]MCM1235991.1 hypothetical protein [Ruminococcus flavefaciens]
MGEWDILIEAGLLSRGERERVCSICMVSEREGFLCRGSVILMIAVVVVMIIIIIILVILGRRHPYRAKYKGWLIFVIGITVVLLIVFYIRFFAGIRATASSAAVIPVSIA